MNKDVTNSENTKNAWVPAVVVGCVMSELCWDSIGNVVSDVSEQITYWTNKPDASPNTSNNVPPLPNYNGADYNNTTGQWLYKSR